MLFKSNYYNQTITFYTLNMKKRPHKLLISLLLLFSAFTIKAQNSAEKKDQIEEHGFNLIIDANEFTNEFVNSGKQVTGIKSIKLDKNEINLAYVIVTVEHKIKPNLNFIEAFCLKAGVENVYVNNEKVSANLYAEKMDKYLQSIIGRKIEK